MHIWGRFFVLDDFTNNRDCLIQVCFNRWYVLVNTNIQLGKWQRPTPSSVFAFTSLDSNWQHCRRLLVTWINRGFPITLAYTCGLRLCFCPTLLTFVLRSVPIRAYGVLSSELTTRSGVRHGCPLLPLLFKYVHEMVLEMTPSSCDNRTLIFTMNATKWKPK